jgi:hypothetical protein
VGLSDVAVRACCLTFGLPCVAACGHSELVCDQQRSDGDGERSPAGELPWLVVQLGESRLNEGPWKVSVEQTTQQGQCRNMARVATGSWSRWQ